MKKPSLKFLFFLFVILTPVLPAGAAQASRASQASQASQTSRASQAREVFRSKLSNGLRVIIVRDPLVPVATTAVNYLAGSDEAPAGFPGMAHAQEHMMFRGSPGLSEDQLARITAEMGGNFDADTQQSVTQYFFTVPAGDLDVALHVEAIRMKGVLDTEKLWAQERGAIEQEVAMDLSDPEYIFYMRLLKRFFAGTPYGHDALGTKRSFDKTTGAMLMKFHETWYAPNNAVLIVCGDVDPSAAMKEIERLFGGIRAKSLPARPAVLLRPVRRAFMQMKTDRPYGLVSMAFRMPGYDSPDYAASVVLSDVLSSQRGALYSLVPKGKALFAGFELAPLKKAGLGYAFAGFPSGANSRQLLASVRGVLLAAVKKGVSADLVAAAKLHEETDAEFDKNSIHGLAESWSQAVAVEGRNSPEDDINAIRKVTVSDVDRVAARYLRIDRSVEAVLTPQVSGRPVSSSGFGGTEKTLVKPPLHVTLPVWAQKALARPRVPRWSFHPVVSTLPNGLRLIVLPESISNTVSVYGRVRNNPQMQTQKGLEGVNSLLGQLFTYGSASLNRIEFQKALDDIGATEQAGANFSLMVLPGHFQRGVQLLAENELHPAMPGNAFRIVRARTAASLQGTIHSPRFLAEQALKKGLFPKTDPDLRYATPKSVSALTLPDVRQYYSGVFRPDMTTIVVIGKIAPAAARSVIGEYFGGWTARGPKPATDFPPVPDNRPSHMTVPDASRVQDVVVMAQTLRLRRTDADYYNLELGNNVLGGAFYATRLYQDLRENTGLVYYVGSELDAGRTRSVYLVVFACDPANVSRASAIVLRDLRQMREARVPEDQLDQAKALLVRKIPLSESSVGQIAGGFLYREANGLPLDEPVLAARKYEKLTAADIKRAFSRWLRPDDMVQVVRGPAPK
ncbi:MAG: pitrilysin family protein [Nitrospiraceae bacterium]|nr:pitrilysin family protein [Nitrospiraceae bacterium]